MILFPVALVVDGVGCRIVTVCPARASLGDHGRYLPPAAGGKRPT